MAYLAVVAWRCQHMPVQWPDPSMSGAEVPNGTFVIPPGQQGIMPVLMTA